jgi:hypothetical protein
MLKIHQTVGVSRSGESETTEEAEEAEMTEFMAK